MHNQSNLTKEKVVNGKKSGIHVVENAIKGHKILECKCTEFFLGLFPKNSHKQRATANLEIPVGATVVRPQECYWNLRQLGSEFTRVPSSSLRTDCVIVEEIIDSDGFDINKKSIPFGWSRICNCYSQYNNLYKYNVGYKHRPEEPLDMNIENTCGSGIYFFEKRH
jgi:hypothetical protein